MGKPRSPQQWANRYYVWRGRGRRDLRGKLLRRDAVSDRSRTNANPHSHCNTYANADCNCDCDSYSDCNFHSNINTNCHRNWHANIDPNCDGKCESDADTQTNAHSKNPCDTEAAANTAASAVTGNPRCCVVGILDRQTGRCGRRSAVYSNANS